MEDNELRDAVLHEILSEVGSRLKLVRITGGGYVGKSTLSRALAKAVPLSLKRSSCLLELDCFLMAPRNRDLGDTRTGYHPNAYRLDEAAETIEKLVRNEIAYVSPYNKSIRDVDADPRSRRTLQAAEVLIVEGCTALSPELLKRQTTRLDDLGALNIFVDASQGMRYRNRSRVELAEVKRPDGSHLTLEDVKRRFRALEADYREKVEPQRASCHLVVQVGEEAFDWVSRPVFG
jgi:uridine kinase